LLSQGPGGKTLSRGTAFGSVVACEWGGPGPTVPAGAPPCTETFLNKPHASSPAACPASFCVGGGSGAAPGDTEPGWAGAEHGSPQRTRVPRAPCGGEAEGETRRREGSARRVTRADPWSSRVAPVTGTHRENSTAKGLFSWHRVQAVRGWGQAGGHPAVLGQASCTGSARRRPGRSHGGSGSGRSRDCCGRYGHRGQVVPGTHPRLEKKGRGSELRQRHGVCLAMG